MLQTIRNLKFIGDILIVLWISCAFFLGKQAEIEKIKTVALAIFLVIGVIIWLLMDQITRRAVKKKIKEIDSYDYKMFFDIASDPNVFTERIAKLFPDKVLTDYKSKSKAPLTEAVWTNTNTGNANNSSLEDEVKELLKKKSSGVHCKRITNEEKKGKCIVECIFVPLDKDGNTLLINRLDYYHPFLYQENMSRLQKPFSKKMEYSLISFSPLPDAFSQEYDPKDIYNKEVFSANNNPPKFDFQGVILRKMEKTCQEDLPIYYLMIVYTAKYDVSFKKTGCISNGKLDLKTLRENTDWNIVKYLFTYSQIDRIPKPNCLTRLRNKIASLCFNVRTMDTLFFEKDHDEICGGINWEDLNRLCNSTSMEMQIKAAEKEIIKHFCVQ
jgi:hypothetical protein